MVRFFTTKLVWIVALWSFLSGGLIAQELDVSKGKELFKNNCAACHNKDMKSKMTGPALGGFQERWTDYPMEDLYAWIRNSQNLVAAKHPKAVELWNEWQPTVMTPFPNLSDQDIDEIFKYIDAVYSGKLETATAETAAAPTEPEKPDYTYVYLIIFVLLAVMAFVLSKIIGKLNTINEAREKGVPVSPGKTWKEVLTSQGVIGFAVFFLVIFLGYTTAYKAINFGRQKGYAPKQPIEYSHATHAGLHQIDCNYCHDGARRSKHAVIPAANTCMNCHKAILVGSKKGTAEIGKLLASAGFNPLTGKYIENYDNMPDAEIEKIFKEWIMQTYISQNGVFDSKGEKLVKDQWNGIVEALTGPEDDRIQGPIEWVRIHNLPDHVYFNHAQHVNVGKLACQDCHGQVQEMEVVEQFTPLSMGWCINCHRTTEVKFAENGYYDAYYEKYHEEIKAGMRTGVTVEEIGGLGCQRCHY